MGRRGGRSKGINGIPVADLKNIPIYVMAYNLSFVFCFFVCFPLYVVLFFVLWSFFVSSLSIDDKSGFSVSCACLGSCYVMSLD